MSLKRADTASLLAEAILNEIMVGLHDRDDVKQLANEFRKYGAMVRAEDVKICESHSGTDKAATAIENTPLP